MHLSVTVALGKLISALDVLWIRLRGFLRFRLGCFAALRELIPLPEPVASMVPRQAENRGWLTQSRKKMHRISRDDTNPTRERGTFPNRHTSPGFPRRNPRLRFGLVSDACGPSRKIPEFDENLRFSVKENRSSCVLLSVASRKGRKTSQVPSDGRGRERFSQGRRYRMPQTR